MCSSLQLAGYPAKTWRHDAAGIVEELFRTTSPEYWDMLIDLRQELLHGRNWNTTFDLFLKCRLALETQHYLPFYRLRNLLAGSLRLEAHGEDIGLARILRRKHRSLADIRRHITRDLFEHELVESLDHPLKLEVVERI
ncbi:hypothetical protein DB345_13120 [Spartobacteria bacterium LR76]|nr:hypothetical protein DB345_13120 [Spartobacteria bacterium LR76]